MNYIILEKHCDIVVTEILKPSPLFVAAEPSHNFHAKERFKIMISSEHEQRNFSFKLGSKLMGYIQKKQGRNL